MNEPVEWTDGGSPRSPRFDDLYRSRYGGLAQARAVYLAGCGLPGRWQGRRDFTVLETGFGLGLNFLCTWAAWEGDAQRCEQLNFVSVEAYPVAAADLLRSVQSLAAMDGDQAPLLARVQVLAAELAAAWSEWSPGLHEIRFADGRVQLILAVGQVLPMLARLSSCQADAVYLDGFTPALNPDMWSTDTLTAMARLCQPGATVASYSVALAVRETLQSLGFTVKKRPGLPPKRHRLEATFERLRVTAAAA
ncbi:tRNA (5-methylaminomethyl-2-thiouridine)(34)-methyltransferase MnmD [Roseateles toxinivorans]|nr:tRNA (5-methylaminomethyl-2-thiouridine)(34)-methyltransferase MnmD [Roseateles toxinivorans]